MTPNAEFSRSRAAFLSRVGLAVRAGNKHRESARRELPATIGYIGSGSDLIGRLHDELQSAGARAIRVQTPDEARSAIRALVDQFSLRCAVMNAARILHEIGMPVLLRDVGVNVVTADELWEMDEADRRERFFAADVGIAAPDWAIAETGTLVYATDSGQARSPTLLPPVHIAVVDSHCVLSDLLDLPTQLEARSLNGVLPRNVALVTGPSKTGDIELKLTTGVHGPGEVQVVIWDRNK